MSDPGDHMGVHETPITQDPRRGSLQTRAPLEVLRGIISCLTQSPRVRGWGASEKGGPAS